MVMMMMTTTMMIIIITNVIIIGESDLQRMSEYLGILKLLQAVIADTTEQMIADPGLTSAGPRPPDQHQLSM